MIVSQQIEEELKKGKNIVITELVKNDQRISSHSKGIENIGSYSSLGRKF